jgi:leukotriene-A4 hydrolase
MCCFFHHLCTQIAHSWSGNLVTNASWEHFWLNEGWTVFLERKIVGRLQVG